MRFKEPLELMSLLENKDSEKLENLGIEQAQTLDDLKRVPITYFSIDSIEPFVDQPRYSILRSGGLGYYIVKPYEELRGIIQAHLSNRT